MSEQDREYREWFVRRANSIAVEQQQGAYQGGPDDAGRYGWERLAEDARTLVLDALARGRAAGLRRAAEIVERHANRTYISAGPAKEPADDIRRDLFHARDGIIAEIERSDP
jgi:hypothetical protein